MPVDTVIKNGTLVTADSILETGIAIDGEKIVAVGDESTLPNSSQTIDASGYLVLPGIVDPHVHFDGTNPFIDDPLETYDTGSAAAALGGVTTIIDFAWQGAEKGADDPETGTLLDGIEYQKSTAGESLIDYGLHGTIIREDPDLFEELSEVIDEGVTSFKMFSVYDWGVSNGFMGRVFDHLSNLDAVAVLHTEDESVCEEQTKILKEQDRGDPTDYPDSRPDYAEAMAADDALRMAMEANCKYYGIHTSCQKAGEVIKRYRGEYGSELVRGETCTHYAALDDSVFSEIGTLAQLSPPIRSPSDVESMFEYLSEGTLDVVSTDHVAYTRDRKSVENWWDCPYGANSLQRSLPVFYDEAVNRRNYSPSFVVKVMSTQPAQIFGFSNKGTLEPGTDADLVFFDPSKRHTITSEDNASKSDYSIYDGRTIQGSVTHTMVRGEFVVRDEHVVGSPGHGKYVAREVPDWQN
ncbi:dihydroorotase [Natrarchaeobius chitinivorans]|uniref:Allantoinase n=1 Tax=Natrarchaeobius chitinivorans TaxID=1679083 RepID=A0A3N6LZZ1_NATCH|nr:amidohydrolase family protein [Natrarchaeobius chitinivorans]RQG96518.1 allantoinase [Natrarchaeobius chitinivorans]